MLPFSPTRIVGNLVFVSGQVGQKDGKVVSEDFREQMTQATSNVADLLSAHNLSFANIIDVTAFLVTQEDYVSFNEIYLQYFKDPFPTRTTVTVKSLPLGAKIELKVIAELKS